MNMKKILGILLALCFLVSVTGAASAADFKGPKEEKKFDKHNDKCFKKVWVKGHLEFKKVTKFIKVKDGHHGFKVIKINKIVKTWVPGHWKIVKVPCKHYGHNDRR
jgi:hypothetical protein